MSDGTFCIRRRQPKAKEEESLTAQLPKKSAFDALLDGDNLPPPKTKASLEDVVNGRATTRRRKVAGDMNELKVQSKRMKRLKDYDKMLKAFKYSAALDMVLKKVSSPHFSI